MLVSHNTSLGDVGPRRLTLFMPYDGLKLLWKMKRSFAAVLMSCVCLSFAAPVAAQDSSKLDSLSDSKLTQPTEGLSFNLPGTQGLGAQGGPELELPVEAVGSSVFKLDLSSPNCASGTEGCLRRDESVKFGLSDTFRRRSEKGLDLSLTPRASMQFDDDVNSTAVGAKIEIGKDLREGTESKNNTWYFFAGADAESLTYSPNSVGRITAGEFHLQDRIIVGDAEAGLGYRIGDADVSLSYKRREATTEDFKFKEDAAALSFTWKR